MYIQYDRDCDNCLAVKIGPSEDQAPYVEITLLGYQADGAACWLPPEVRLHNGAAETTALKEATHLAGHIVDRLQAETDPVQALEGIQYLALPAAA